MAFRVPNNSERLCVIGRTGSGKTQGAAFFLSRMDTVSMPWLLLDFKREELFNEIGAFDLPDWNPPRFPGIYKRTVTPYDVTAGRVDEILLKVHQQGGCGIFIDEGMSLGNSHALNTVLTQGRSLEIPMIVCTQRPKRVSLAVFSEADFFALFNLTNPDDKKLVSQYMGQEKPLPRLPRFHFYWYDVVEDQLLKMRPVPDRLEIARVISAKQASLVQTSRSRIII